MLSAYEEKNIILEHAMRECMSNNIIKLNTEFERESRTNIPKVIMEQLDNYSDTVSKKERSIETNKLIIKNEFETPRDEVMKLLRDYIDHEVLNQQTFRQQIRDNDPISSYKALHEQFLIATSTDFATVHANQDERAAICHDVGHTGNSNALEVATSSALAIIVGTSSFIYYDIIIKGRRK
jgi:hypothetical protein